MDHALKHEIREIRKEDNAAVANMIRAVFDEFNAEKKGTVYSDPTTDQLFELFKQEKSRFYVALLEDEIVGCCGVFPSPGLPEGCAELVKLYLAKEARGKGIGRDLMERSTEAAKELGYKQLYLESLSVFKKAVQIYLKQGFKQIDQALSTVHPGCNLWFLKDL